MMTKTEMATVVCISCGGLAEQGLECGHLHLKDGTVLASWCKECFDFIGPGNDWLFYRPGMTDEEIRTGILTGQVRSQRAAERFGRFGCVGCHGDHRVSDGVRDFA